jgi:3-oxoacyl-[acyl-carrier protein] reductase
MNEIDFHGKNVLVVGGSSGIGNGIARVFRDHKANVFVCGTRASTKDYEADDGSDFSGMTYFQWDVSDDKIVENLKPPFSSLDTLVLSQGIVMYKRAEFQMPNFRKVLDVNLMSVMSCCMKFYEMLKATKGTVVIVGSGASFHAVFGNPAYSASKGALVTFTKSLAEAWAIDGIRVNGIAPGLVATKITKVTWDHPRRYEDSLNEIPLHRWGTPEEMGRVSLFLASPLSSYVTGQMIIIDGGMSLS